MGSSLNIDTYNTYPAFSANQVLTHSQLNDLRIYLDQQNRLTRIRTTGAGIICGLHADYAYEGGRPSISISKGYGISSDGFIIELLADTTYEHYRVYQRADLNDDDKDDYEWLENLLKKTEGKPHDEQIFELISEVDDQKGPGGSKFDPGKIKALDDTILKDKVIILLLKKVYQENDPCVLTHCNNQGNNIEMKVVPILVPRDLIEKDSDKSHDCSSYALHVPSLASAIDSLSPVSSGKNPEDEEVFCILGKLLEGEEDPIHRLNIAYSCIVEYIEPLLSKGIQNIYKNYQNCLNLEIDIEMLIDCLEDQFNKGKDKEYSQYHFDYIRDLVCAWNELLMALCQLNHPCFLSNSHPCHLIIGTLRATGQAKIYEITRGLRTAFRPSGAQNVIYHQLSYTRSLFLRIKAMISHFSEDIAFGQVPASTPADYSFKTIITPSQTERYLLGERAIPFYYYLLNGSESDFSKYWQPKQSHTIDPILSYYRDHPSLNPTTNNNPFPVPYKRFPLSYTIHKNTFLRIEGHVGKEVSEAYQDIVNQKRRYNLDFSVVILTLDEASALALSSNLNAKVKSLASFANSCCGMIHTGGVPIGGTFLMLVDKDQTVAADFSIEGCCACACSSSEKEDCSEILRIDYEFIEINSTEAIVKFTAITSDPGPATYTWDFGDGTQTTETTSTITYKFPHSRGNIFSVSLEIKGSDERCSDQKTIEVNTCPVIESLEIIKGQLTDTDLPVEVKVNFSGPPPVTFIFEWGDGSPSDNIPPDPSTPSSRTHTHTYTRPKGSDETNTITVKLVGPVNCTSDESDEVIIPGLREESSGQESSDFQARETQTRGISPDLTSRRTTYLTEVMNLNSAGDFSRNRTFQSVTDFLSDSFKTDRERNEAFKDVVGKTTALTNRKSTPQVKKLAYLQMLEKSWQRFADDLIMSDSEKIDATTLGILTETISDLKNAGVNLKKLGQNWKTSEITATKTGKEINKLLK